MSDGPIASGWRGSIYLKTKGGKRIATKRANTEETKAALTKEVQILQKLEKEGIDFVPHVIEQGEREFSYEWIPGERFDLVYQRAPQAVQLDLVQELLDKVYQLDQVGVIHGELRKPTSNILVDEQGKISIIDFERGKFGDTTGKNMRNLAQWLASQGVVTYEVCQKLGEIPPAEIYTELQQHITTYYSTPRQHTAYWTGARFWGTIAGLVAVDQFTKYLFVDLQIASELWLFTPAFNPGSARSMPVPIGVTLVITLTVLVFVSISFIKKWYQPWLLVLIAAGATGNGIDRVLLGGVRDFIDFHYWPIFNIADILLTGATILLVREIIRDVRKTT